MEKVIIYDIYPSQFYKCLFGGDWINRSWGGYAKVTDRENVRIFNDLCSRTCIDPLVAYDYDGNSFVNIAAGFWNVEILKNIKSRGFDFSQQIEGEQTALDCVFFGMVDDPGTIKEIIGQPRFKSPTFEKAANQYLEKFKKTVTFLIDSNCGFSNINIKDYGVDEENQFSIASMHFISKLFEEAEANHVLENPRFGRIIINYCRFLQTKGFIVTKEFEAKINKLEQSVLEAE